MGQGEAVLCGRDCCAASRQDAPAYATSAQPALPPEIVLGSQAVLLLTGDTAATEKPTKSSKAKSKKPFPYSEERTALLLQVAVSFLSGLRPSGFAQALRSRAMRAPVGVTWRVSPRASPHPAHRARGPMSSQPRAISPCPARWCRLHVVTGLLPHVAAPSQPAQPPQAAVP